MIRTAQEEIELRATGMQIADARLRAKVDSLGHKNRRIWVGDSAVYWLIGAPDNDRFRYHANWSVEADAAGVMLAALERIAQRRRLEATVDDHTVFVPIHVYIAAATQTAELAQRYGDAIDHLTAAGVGITFPTWQAGTPARQGEPGQTDDPEGRP